MGNRKQLVKLLLEFCRSFALSPAQIESAMTTGDTVTACLLAHSIKGAAGNLGAMELFMAASKLETLIRENIADPGGVEYREFCNSMKIVLDNHAYLLELNQLNIDDLTAKNNLEQTSLEQFDELKNKMSQLRAMIKENSFSAGDFAQDHLTGSAFLDQEKLRDLLEMIEAFDYEQAMLLLDGLESGLDQVRG